MTALLLQFLLCAMVVGVAGLQLSRSADALAEAHGWGRGWVGLALLATITSLPELASGVSAVAWVGAVDLAVGNALGACTVNLLFLVVVDALHGRQPLYRHASSTHLLSAGFGVVMLSFVLLSLLSGRAAPGLMNVGFYSPLLLGLYLLALRSLFLHEHGHLAAKPARRDTPQRARLWGRFAGSALLVLLAGGWLPHAAEALVLQLGLSRQLVGTVFMALVTTLPEMAVTLGALRLGQLDMAIGNLLGSNLFNLAILAIDDLAYRRGPLLADASPAHAASATAALLMHGLVIVGLVLRPQGRVLRLTSWVSIGLVATFALHATFLL